MPRKLHHIQSSSKVYISIGQHGRRNHDVCGTTRSKIQKMDWSDLSNLRSHPIIYISSNRLTCFVGYLLHSLKRTESLQGRRQCNVKKKGIQQKIYVGNQDTQTEEGEACSSQKRPFALVREMMTSRFLSVVVAFGIRPASRSKSCTTISLQALRLCSYSIPGFDVRDTLMAFFLSFERKSPAFSSLDHHWTTKSRNWLSFRRSASSSSANLNLHTSRDECRS